MERKIKYEPHPVTPERKAELKAQGYKIIDARFKPADLEPESYSSMTVAQLKAMFEGRELEVPADAKKADLVEALEANDEEADDDEEGE